MATGASLRPASLAEVGWSTSVARRVAPLLIAFVFLVWWLLPGKRCFPVAHLPLSEAFVGP